MTDIKNLFESSGKAFMRGLAPENPWAYDLGIIASLWLAARVPLIAWGVPPMVQCDSFCYQNFYNTIRRPHYPFLFGEFIEIFGHYHGMIVQHFLVLSCAFMFYFIAKSVAGRPSGLLSGIVVACYGGFVLYAQSIMSETLFNFFLAAHLLLLWIAIKKEAENDPRHLAWFFLTGLCVGIGANVRPVIQYQAAIICLVLLPFYVLRRALKTYVKIALVTLAGFLMVYLYVAGATYRHYGIFGLSAGLPKAAMYRLVDNPEAPLAGVRTSDPMVAAVRDYLVKVGSNDDVIWLHAYEHIQNDIIPVFVKDRPATMLDVDRVVMKLWRLYAAAYPYQYTMKSLQGLIGILMVQDFFSGLWEFSTRMYQGEYRKLPEKAVNGLTIFYILLSVFVSNTLLFIFIMVLAAKFTLLVKGPRRAYMVCLLATMFFIFVPQFFASPGIPRYRYPMDMVYFLILGIVFFYPRPAWKWEGMGLHPLKAKKCAE